MLIPSKSGRSILLDYTLPEGASNAPVIVFAHGFKGFKDWGYWNLMAQKFAEAGYAFVKFNFSHNGTTPEQPTDFTDLNAFGENTFSKELLDIESVLDWLYAEEKLQSKIDLQNLTFIGHSRGGGIGILAANEDPRIHRLVTWASVAKLDYFWENKPELLEKWEKDGIFFVLNGRTKQNMPLGWELVTDFQENKNRFDTEQILRDFAKPMCILHGKADPAVPPVSAQQLHLWNPNAELFLIDGADHVFGGSHPYSESYLPIHAQVLFSRTVQFLER